MSAPRPRTTPALTPEAASLLDTYFARVQGAMLLTAADEAADAIEELRDHVLDELAGTDGSASAVTRVLAELGPPERLAAAYAEEDTDRHTAPTTGGADEPDSGIGHGRVLGMPFDLRVPTAARVASRWWDPMNPRVFVPRVWGLGWDVNFGAVAVKLGFVRPDDEDEPFAAVPREAMLAALAVPVAITLAVIITLALRYAGLPAELPRHWDMAGTPDGWWPKAGTAAFALGLSVLPTLWAAAAFARRRPALNRAAAVAFATLLSMVAAGELVQTLFTVAKAPVGTWPAFVTVVLAFVLPFVQLTVLSRLGRSAEQRRDLDR